MCVCVKIVNIWFDLTQCTKKRKKKAKKRNLLGSCCCWMVF
jgi:hypothetical protein